MKKIVLYAAALLMLCGVTGCGKAGNDSNLSVYTDIDSHDSNIIRHCVEQPEDEEEPDTWIYTELVVGNRIRYITSTETTGSTETEKEMNEDSESPTEIDIFDGADLEITSDYYPVWGIKAEFHSEFENIETTYETIKATPSQLVVRVTADENSKSVKENNYILKSTSKDYEFDVSEIPHILMSQDEITDDIEDTLISGMAAATKETLDNDSLGLYKDPAPLELRPVALYTLFPPEDADFLSMEKTLKYGSSYGFESAFCGIFISEQNEYYVAYTGNTEFIKDGSWDADGVAYAMDEAYPDFGEADPYPDYKYSDFESAYKRVEEKSKAIENEQGEACMITEFKTYTDQATVQPETTETSTSEE